MSRYCLFAVAFAFVLFPGCGSSSSGGGRVARSHAAGGSSVSAQTERVASPKRGVAQSRRPGSARQLSSPNAMAKRTWDNFPLDVVFFDDPAAELKQRSVAVGQSKPDAKEAAGVPASQPLDVRAVSSTIDWSELISKDDLLAEVSAIRGRLAPQMAELELYNGHYREVRVDAAVLAVLVGIVAVGEFDVPWQRHALHIRDVAGQLSSEANGLGPRNYTPARASFQKLTPLFEGKPAKVEGLDANPIRDMPWMNVADLSPLMQRMKTALEIRIREASADRSQWRKAKESIRHEAAMLAVLGQVISTSYDGSDDEEYRQYAAALKREALDLMQATGEGDYDAVSQRIARVSRSCKDCHDDYRFADDF